MGITKDAPIIDMIFLPDTSSLSHMAMRVLLIFHVFTLIHVTNPFLGPTTLPRVGGEGKEKKKKNPKYWTHATRIHFILGNSLKQLFPLLSRKYFHRVPRIPPRVQYIESPPSVPDISVSFFGPRTNPPWPLDQ